MKVFEKLDVKGKIVSYDDFRFPVDRNEIPEAYKKSIRENAEKALATDVPMILASQFREFVQNGNRVHMEAPYLARRNALTALMLGEFTFDDGRYLDKMIDYLWAICEESTWKLSAHNNHNSDENFQLPVEFADDVYFIDLFAAQTGAFLAIAYRLFGKKLDEACPVCLTKRIAYELDRRIFHPFERYGREFWWSGCKGNYVNNWNPWIVANILTTAAFAEKDMQKRETFTATCCEMIDHFIGQLPEDGTCEEGPSYWGAAFGAVISFMEMLADVSGGRIQTGSYDFLRAAAEYVPKMYVGDSRYVPFNDCPIRVMHDMAMLYRFGLMTHSRLLTDFAGETAKISPFHPNSTCPANVFRYITTAIPAAVFNPERVYYLPSRKIMTVREEWNGHKLMIGAKAGSNNEGHGHLDCGNFVLYVDGEAVLIDAGSPTYCKDTFNENRFKNWQMRSPYHNTAGVDELEQGYGGKFRADDVNFEEGVLSFELKNTFTDPDGIVSLRRVIDTRDGFDVTDTFAFEAERTYRFYLLTIVKPLEAEGKITIGGAAFVFTPNAAVTVETVDDSRDRRAAESYHTANLYRTTFSVRAKEGKFTFALAKQ